MKNFLLNKLFIILLIALFSNLSYSQQVFTINSTLPTGSGNYATFTEAFNYLNTLTVSESVTFNVASGQEFNEELPPLTVLGTSTFPIIFQKQGTAANPIIKCPTAVATDDGVVYLQTSAYVTFDGIDVTDPNPTDAIYLLTNFYVNASNYITIKNCNISNFSKNGIWLRGGSSNVNIDNNNIFYTTDYVSNSLSIYCIYSQSFSSLNQNINITRNKLYGVNSTLTSIVGIRVDNANNLIANNFITFQNSKTLTGIRIAPSVSNLGMVSNILHNTILFEGTPLESGVCLVTFSNYAHFQIKNNIFINNRSSLNFNQFSIYISDILKPTFDLDNNIYYCREAPNNFLGNWGGATTNLISLSDWQTETNKDLHSRIVDAQFTNVLNGDLHLTGSLIGNFALSGVGVPEVTTDIDGQLRDTEFPYAGADEVLSNPLNIHVYVAPMLLDFGTTYITQHKDLPFVISNLGTSPVTVDSILFNKLSIPFLLSSDAGTTWNDTLKNINILDGETQTVQLRFSPTEMMSYNFMTKVFLNNGQIIEIIDTTQIALPLGIQLNTYALDFGTLYVNNESNIQTFNIENTFATDLTVNSITAPTGFLIRKQGTTDWLSDISNFQITGNNSQIIEIKFVPTEQIVYDNNLIVMATTLTNIELDVALKGKGKAMDYVFSEFGEPLQYGSTAFGDYDNDGDLDVFTAGYGNGSKTNLYRNDGNMNFTPITTNIAGIGAGTINVIDSDNDNDLDIFVCGQLEFGVIISRLYTNNNGVFTEANRNFVALTVPSSDWADYDTDGDLDFIITGGDSTSMSSLSFTYIYKNMGNNNFVVDTTFYGIQNGNVKWADYDNDGDKDFAITGRFDANIFITKVFENQNGYFAEAADLFGVRYSKLDWGDYDNDNDLDLIVSGSINTSATAFLPAESRIYRNDGNNVFTDINSNILAVQYGDIKWVDINQDSKLDIVMNGIYSYTQWIGYYYLNKGNDIFEVVEAPDTIVSLKHPEMQFGDLDGDMDLDMVLTGWYNNDDFRCQLFKNVYPVQNTAPSAPTNLNYNINNYNVNLEWTPAVDTKSQSALSYNLRIGNQTASDNIFNSMSQNSSGYRLIAKRGNIDNNSVFTIPYLPDGTYHASLQAIDNSFINSPFSNEIIFTINKNSPPTLVNSLEDKILFTNAVYNFQIPNNTFADIDTVAGDHLNYTATLADNSSLPNWLIFNENTHTFVASPTIDNVGTISVKVTVTDLSNQSASDEFNITVNQEVNINNLINSEIKIYPNPTSENLNIDLTNYKNVNLEIVNTLGQIIFTEKNISNELKNINLSNFAKGIYFINIQTDNKVYTKKFILK